MKTLATDACAGVGYRCQPGAYAARHFTELPKRQMREVAR